MSFPFCYVFQEGTEDSDQGQTLKGRLPSLHVSVPLFRKGKEPGGPGARGPSGRHAATSCERQAFGAGVSPDGPRVFAEQICELSLDSWTPPRPRSSHPPGPAAAGLRAPSLTFSSVKPAGDNQGRAAGNPSSDTRVGGHRVNILRRVTRHHTRSGRMQHGRGLPPSLRAGHRARRAGSLRRVSRA